MSDAEIEAMIAFALERLLAGHEPSRRAMVREMADRWPDAPALSLVLALTDASARIDATLDRWSDPRDAARYGYRTAALVACDVYAVEASGTCPATLRDLQLYWRDRDPFFLEG